MFILQKNDSRKIVIAFVTLGINEIDLTKPPPCDPGNAKMTDRIAKAVALDAFRQNKPPWTESERIKKWVAVSSVHYDGAFTDVCNSVEIFFHEILFKSIEGDEKNPVDWTVVAAAIKKSKIFIALRDTEKLLYYDHEHGIYRHGEEVKMKEIVTELLGDEVSTHMMDEIVEKVRRSKYVNRAMFTPETPLQLVVENGILNVLTGELRQFDPEFLSFTAPSVYYDLDVRCPMFTDFLRQVHYSQDIPTVQEGFGFNLWPLDLRAQKAMMLVGDRSNGKSMEIQVLQALTGEENRTSISLHDFEERPFLKFQLFGKLADLYADLPERDLKSTGIFKQLPSGDHIFADEKFSYGFTFENVVKLTFSANKVPKVHDDSITFFRR